jgi:hypothetical protein
MVASENAQQGPESEIATIVDEDVADKTKNTDASDPSQTEQVGTSKDLQNHPESKTIQAEVIAKNVGAEEKNDIENGFGTATSKTKENDFEDGDGKITSVNKENDSKIIVNAAPSVDKENVSKESISTLPSVDKEK